MQIIIMNKTLLISLRILFWIIIIWFIGYFVFGEYIAIEFSDYTFAQHFPKYLTFAAGASIYFLFLLSIRLKDKWNWKNILKFLAGIGIGFMPFVLFKYYSSVGNCQNWEVIKTNKKTLFQSITSESETIQLIEIECPEMEIKEEKIYRVMHLTPVFNVKSEIDTTKLKFNHWKNID